MGIGPIAAVKKLFRNAKGQSEWLRYWGNADLMFIFYGGKPNVRKITIRRIISL